MSHLGDLISTVLQTAARELPKEGMVAVWVALVLGLLIWFRGRKMAKLAFAGIGALMLGLVGFLLADSVAGPGSAWMGGIAGLIAGAILGAMLLKFTVAVALALVGALVVPMLTATAMLKWGTPPELREQAQSLVDSTKGLLLEGVPEVPDLGFAEDRAVDALKSSKAAEDSADGIDRARAFLARLGEEIKPVWEEVPEDDRILLLASSLVGAGFGFVFGLFFHKKATAFVTAGIGAAVWIPAAAVAYTSFDSLPHPESAVKPAVWAGLWIGATILGVILQSRVGRKSSDSRREQNAPSSG